MYFSFIYLKSYVTSLCCTVNIFIYIYQHIYNFQCRFILSKSGICLLPEDLCLIFFSAPFIVANKYSLQMSLFHPPHLKDIFFLNRIIDKGIFFHCSKILFHCLLTSIIPLERKAVNSFVLITLLCLYSLFFSNALFFLL